MTILNKYNQAKFYTAVCPEQREIFSWWTALKDKPCISMDTETTSLYFGLPSMLCKSILTIDSNFAVDSSEKERPVKKGKTIIQKIEKSKKQHKSLLPSVADFVVEQRENLTVFGISCAVEMNGRVNCFWGRLGSPLFKDLCVLAGVEGPKCFHNARFDIRAMEVSGITLAPEVECTYTMSRIYWDRRKAHGLDDLTKFLCPEICDWEDPIRKELSRLKKMFKKAGYPDDYVNYSFVPDKLMGMYAMKDAFMGLCLYNRLQQEATWQ
jgi:hypothetical protein